MNKMHRIVLLTALLIQPFSAKAEPPAPKFLFPLDCKLGQTCWPANYVDMDTNENSARDFTCGPRTYDAHKGTDFAVRTRAEMEKGVDVLAAMDGTVLRLRDGETDTLKAGEDLQKIREANKDCGNGVMIDHAKAGFPGLSSMYCHLKRGSITVKPGDPVKAGQAIGKLGQSGFAEFPHLHFSIIWEGAIMDPYTGATQEQGCGTKKTPLWKDAAITYSPLSIYDGGFLPGKPDFTAIKNGQDIPKTLPTGSSALVFWTAMFGVREGDTIDLTITDPSGATFIEQTKTQDKTRARQFYYIGRKAESGLLPGPYTGHITLTREGLPKQEKHFTVTIN